MSTEKIQEVAENDPIQLYPSSALNLTVDADDGRYPIHVHIKRKHVFTLYFNPGDPFVMKYADEIESLEAPTGVDAKEFIKFGESLERSLDAIFGEGSARQIFRYDGADHALLYAVMGKLKTGYEDFTERAKAAANAAKIQAVIDAKKEAKAFTAPS